MTDEQQAVPQFPQFPPAPVNPNGLAGIHPKQQGPLNKMINRLLKPKMKLKTPKHRTWKKKNTFY